MSDIITLAHGSGGRLTHNLIKDIFKKYFTNDILDQGNDSAVFSIPKGRLAFTTDSYVISPIFFRGGDIGKLSVCGTVNDLVSSGAMPMFLSCGFILEEGLELKELEKIVCSMGETAKLCGVKIVTGDTKVVQKGAADKIFINTTGLGRIPDEVYVSGDNAKPGDKIIITGDIGDHGCAILLDRERLDISSGVISDCAPLNNLLESVFKISTNIHVLRDPTRGGLATTLNEIAVQSKVGIKLYEDQLPIKEEVRGICELLGMDPLYMANEGKMIIIVPEIDANLVLNELRKNEKGLNACIIGEVLEAPANKVFMKTITGGSRIIDMLVGDQLPRIC